MKSTTHAVDECLRRVLTRQRRKQLCHRLHLVHIDGEPEEITTEGDRRVTRKNKEVPDWNADLFRIVVNGMNVNRNLITMSCQVHDWHTTRWC
jgi:hypothetical protein